VETPRKAVVLLSGGLDSATCLGVAIRDGFTPVALTIDYGQRHSVEVERARLVARSFGVADHRVVRLDLRAIGGSALTDEIAVPKHATADEVTASIPITYVPARNTVFLAVALGLAEATGSSDLFIGANAVDYSGYPDCRPEFLTAFEALANLATRAGVQGQRFHVHAPLVASTKAQIIRLGRDVGVDFALTHSCYDPQPGGACGCCDSCLLRKKGFAEAGLTDPVPYAAP
jgi:7-cyano-7-deazaguanine synthase